MDLNYNIHTWDVSLETITLTKITQLLVENAIPDPSFMDEPMTVASRASKNAQKLKLPSSLITKIQKMVRPIMYEMITCYSVYGSKNRPILTALGTMDAEKNARACMNCSDQDPNYLFALACSSCFEDDIFFHGKQNSDSEGNYFYEHSNHESHMSYFWRKTVYECKFVHKITKKDISAGQCLEGFQLALKFKHSLAIKYFLDKTFLIKPYMCVQPEYVLEIARYHNSNIDVSNIMPDADICAKILRHAEYLEGVAIKRMLSIIMLNSLLRWPYQHLFLEAAQTLTANLDAKGFSQVVEKIVEKKSQGYEDSDYTGLITNFCGISKYVGR